MRLVGTRRIREITMHADGELLKEGALFNDEIHKLPTGKTMRFKKGIYRYKSHDEANQHQDACLIEQMVDHANR